MGRRAILGILVVACLLAAAPVSGGTVVPALPSPADGEAVRALLAPHLSPAELSRALADKAGVRRMAGLLARLRAGGDDLSLQVDVQPAPDGGRAIFVSLRRGGSLEHSDGDRAWRGRAFVTLDEASLALAPPPAPRRAAMPPSDVAAPAPAADAVPAGEPPCAAADDACWRHRTWAGLQRHPPACEPYLVEQDTHLRRLAVDPDPNGVAARPDLDPGAAERDRRQRTREMAGAYPSGTIETSTVAIPRRITVTNRPPASAPTPTEPPDDCTASLADGALAAVPALACTRDLLHWRAWRSDPLVAANRATLGLLASLPLVDFLLSRKARALADDRSPAGIWAALWVERWQAARERGDRGWQDRAARALAESPEERAALASRARRWLATPAQAPWHAALRALYEERFTALYPESADPDGLPDLGRFPTRFWWATNWLSEAARRGWSAAEAADRLRCGPDGERAAAILRDLAVPLGRDPRFLSLLPGMLEKW